MIKGVLIDLDGVIYNDSTVVPGAAQAVAWLSAKNIPFRFITNTTMKSRKTLREKLGNMGISIGIASIFSAAFAAAEFLRKQKENTCYCILTADALSEFSGVNYSAEKVRYVVLGDPGAQVNFNRLNKAFLHLMEGARLIALQKNRFWLSDSGYQMDAGPFVAMLEYAARTQALLIGKPSATFFEMAAENMRLKTTDLLMIGDDMESDIVGAHHLGMKTCLVKTGKFLPADLLQSAVQPDLILASIADLPRSEFF